MKKQYLLFLGVVVWCILCGNLQASEIEQIQEKGEIIVSLNKDYPPFSMDKDGKPMGLDVDLARLLAEYMGVKVKFIRPALYEEQIPALLSGKADIIIAAMTRTAERGLLVNFTDPYFAVSQAALVKREKVASDAESYFDLTNIPNLKLGVKAGTTHEAFARQLFSKEAIVTYPTVDAAAKALINNKIDAVTADSPFVRVWRATHPSLHPQVKALLAPVTQESYGFAIRKGDQDFLNWLNLFIDQIRADGTLDLLIHEYFVQLKWTKISASAAATTPAQMLNNKFLQQKKEMLEERRIRAINEKGGTYE